MFGQLPKLFDRDFAIGYFLPVIVFVLIGMQVLSAFGMESGLHTALTTNLVVGTTLIGLVSWLGAVLLLATNHQLYRFMEGYGAWNPMRLLSPLQRCRFRRLRRKTQSLDHEYQSYVDHDRKFPSAKAVERARLIREASQFFPDDEQWLLPSAFGNAIRGFEVYSRVMYGMDAIEGWTRVLTVLPKEYRALVDSAKAQTDLWVNFFVLSLVIIGQSLALSIYVRQLTYWWIPVLSLFFAIFAARLARTSAIQWGELVKSTFDVFLPKLRKKLEFSPPRTLAEEQALWRAFSQAILYRLPQSMPNRSPTPNREGQHQAHPAENDDGEDNEDECDSE
jgi:hypothetical protein